MISWTRFGIRLYLFLIVAFCLLYDYCRTSQQATQLACVQHGKTYPTFHRRNCYECGSEKVFIEIHYVLINTFQVELNDTNRLSKTNTYYDAFITAKIGAAIIRYKTKMILNVNDLHVSGSQIGDEIWEKLWEQNVFSEAQRLDIVQNHQHDMGQLHKFDVDIKSKIDSKNGHRKTQAQKSSAGIVFTTMTSVFLSVVCLAAFVV